jgi:uncharacterized coiled-coil protein SlyX
MRIDDLEKRVAAQEQYTIEGAVNLNVTSQLLVALMQAMLASESMTARVREHRLRHRPRQCACPPRRRRGSAGQPGNGGAHPPASRDAAHRHRLEPSKQ